MRRCVFGAQSHLGLYTFCCRKTRGDNKDEREKTKMKRALATVLALALILGLAGCGKSENTKQAEALIDAIGEVSLGSRQAIEEAELFYDSLTAAEKEKVENLQDLKQAIEKYEELEADLMLTELTADSWINVNSGDVYTLRKDGTGTHNDIAVTYTVSEDTVAIVEGLGSVQAKNFQWDRYNPVPRLIPDNENVYYVRSRDYDSISRQIKDENIRILLSQEFWKASNDVAFLQFLEGGTGWVVMTGTTLGMTWEMVDNNTVKCHLDYNGGQNMNLVVFNDNGTYTLLGDKGTNYVPYHN